MKIGAYQVFNINNNKISTKAYLTGRCRQTRPFARDVVSFGHYLDSDSEQAKDKWYKSHLNLESLKNSIKREKENAKIKIDDLDKEIDAKKQKKQLGLSDVETLLRNESKLDKDIECLESEGEEIKEAINQGKPVLEKTRKEQIDISNRMRQDAIEARTKRNKLLNESRAELSKTFLQDTQKTLTSPKNSLIRSLINPAILESEGDNIDFPHAALFFSEQEEASAKVFEWLVAKTNSNYVVLDANDFESTDVLMKILKPMSERSKQEFENSQNRTFTLIEHFENFAESLEGKTEAFFEKFNNIFKKYSKNYYNTIVVATADQKFNAQCVNKFESCAEFVFAKDFIADKRLGLATILDDLKNIKPVGKNLLLSPFESSFKRFI